MLKTLLYIIFILSTSLSAADSLDIRLNADFNGDNNKDIFLSKNNEFNILLMDGINTQYQGSPAFILEPELSLKAAFALNSSAQAKADKALQKALSLWSPRFITDLNNDHNDDIIFVHKNTQQISIQLMDGVSILDTNKPSFNLEPSLSQAISDAPTESAKLKLEKNLAKALSSWILTHVADFNGDGNHDLLFTHKKTFRNRIQLMDGYQVLSGDEPLFELELDLRNSVANASDPKTLSKAQKTLDKALSYWRLRYVVDLNNDNNTDLIFVHTKSRAVSIQFMDGLNVLSSQSDEFKLALEPEVFGI